MRNNRRSGFTLIELLIVIAIIAILSTVVLLTINPVELLRQSRDADRLSDLSVLKTAVSLYLVDVSAPQLASSSFGYSACYLSSTSGNGTSSAQCGIFANTSLTVDASTTSANYRNINGTGWVPINFSKMSEGSPFGALPVDPLNNATNYYAYAATSSTSSFKFSTFMESARYGNGGIADVVSKDGGTNPNAYEVGSNLGL
jgi:prepilin-type N-terminal cleavage/methylation domain-containing protein